MTERPGKPQVWITVGLLKVCVSKLMLQREPNICQEVCVSIISRK